MDSERLHAGGRGTRCKNGRTEQPVRPVYEAVFARAKADLLGEFATIGRRDTHPGQESMETRAGLLAEASVVIRRMKGLKRATVKKV